MGWLRNPSLLVLISISCRIIGHSSSSNLLAPLWLGGGVLAILDDLTVISTSGASDVAFTGSPSGFCEEADFGFSETTFDFVDFATAVFQLSAALLAASEALLAAILSLSSLYALFSVVESALIQMNGTLSYGLYSYQPPNKFSSYRGLNSQPPAWEAGVLTTRPRLSP